MAPRDLFDDAAPVGGRDLFETNPPPFWAKTPTQMKREASESTARQYDRLPFWAKPIQAAQDVATIGVDSLTGGWADKAAAGSRSLFGGGKYQDELADVRNQTQKARDRAGSAAIGADVVGAVAGPSIVSKGAGALSRIGLGLAEGAGYGLLNATGHDEDALTGTLTGGAFGAAGTAAGEAITKGVNAITRPWKVSSEQSALYDAYLAAKRAGLTEADINAQISRLGPEGFAADVLGKHGTSLGRSASNLNPEARTILEDATSGRKAGQNTRVAETITDAAGLPRGTRQTVDDLKAGLYSKQKPAIDAAYDTARATGFDLPRTQFEDIITTPMGRQAYDSAADSLLNRVPTGGPNVPSELARLDQTKRTLDSRASVAFRGGDNDVGSQAQDLARALRQRLDDSMAGPTYANARKLRQDAYATEEAADIGQRLAGGSIPADLPGQATAARGANPEALSQGYALQQSENLLNKGSTEGALNRMQTPLGREAAGAALGPQGLADITQRLDAEKVFNSTNRDLVGNSTTARQLMEMYGPTGAGAAYGLATTDDWSDPMDVIKSAGTGAGMGWALGKGKNKLQDLLQIRKAAAAPDLARLLVGSPSGIPLTNPISSIDPTIGPVMRDRLARLFSRGAISQTDGGQ